MRGLLKFLLVVGVVIAVLVFVVLPVVAGPILTSLARGSGFAGDDVTVDVEANGAQLLGGTADGLRLRGGALEAGGMSIGDYDVTVGGVSVFDREFDTVRGRLGDVSLASGGRTLRIESLELDGPADAARAVGRVDEREGERLIRDAARRAGLPADEVSLEDDAVAIRDGGRTTRGRLAVDDEGAVVVELERGRTVELLGADGTGRWRVEDIRATADGIALEGTLDVRSFAEDVPLLGG